MEVEWARLSAPALRAKAGQDAIVLLPVASTEQHGPHLAVGVDVLLCGEVCRRAARKLEAAGVPAVVAPVLWPGLAEHHVAFGGTFTLSVATWHAVLRDLCRSILRAGFRKILIVNGHGGNIAALNALNVELTRELDAPVVSTTYFTVGGDLSSVLEDQPGVMHACEAETSMMMAVHPDLVDREQLPAAHGSGVDARQGPFGGAFNRWRSFADLTKSGVRGDARRASAEKGERIFELVADGLVAEIKAGDHWD